jgi:hypothetical protein
MPSAKKISAQQARDKRSKMILIGLLVVLVLVMVIELPSLMGGKKSSAPASTTAATTTGATTTPAGTPAAPSASLATAVVVATPQPGQLRVFSRFGSKDPFHALVVDKSGSSPSSGGAGSTTPAPSKVPPAKTPKSVTFTGQPGATTTTPTGPMVLAAVLKLNGHRVVIPVGTEFPVANPVFKLEAVGRKAMWISLVGGSFGNGDQALKVELGHPVKLVNTTVDTSFVLNLLKMKLVPKPAAPPAAPPTTTTTSTTATSATTTTSPTTTN